MNSEYRYIPYSPDDENLRGLIQSGNVYNIKRGMSGILLPDEPYSDIDEAWRDLKTIKEMYPARLKMISAMVEEECDKLEYDGSPMLAEYPDKEQMRKIARDIYEKLDIKEDVEFPDDVAASYNPPPYVPKGPGCVNCMMRNIVELLVCNEFFCRRDRHRRRRRRFY
ncbi:MAG: hypothetical protein ACI4EF_13565 [Coprococcus sp.]